MTESWIHTIVTPDGVTRCLGLIPSRVYAAGVLPIVQPLATELVPPADLVPYDAWPHELPILDQGSWNACTYYSSAQALQYAQI